jgi:hypothetical protein
VANTTYTCINCGQIHTDWPALTFDSPAPFNALPVSLRNEIAELSGDSCIIKYPEGTYRFIRTTLTIKVIDHCQHLDYGIWVSLSEKNFEDYVEHFNSVEHERKYFGWLSNYIPEYGVFADIPTMVFTRINGLRPEVVPDPAFDHQLVRDYYNGISKTEAEDRIQRMLSNISS